MQKVHLFFSHFKKCKKCKKCITFSYVLISAKRAEKSPKSYIYTNIYYFLKKFHHIEIKCTKCTDPFFRVVTAFFPKKTKKTGFSKCTECKKSTCLRLTFNEKFLKSAKTYFLSALQNLTINDNFSAVLTELFWRLKNSRICIRQNKCTCGP